MTKITDRERLLRIVHGENLDDSVFLSVEYSLDIRGKITIWGGMEFDRTEATPVDDLRRRVNRQLVPVYEYSRLSPYTARIYQIEEELDSTIPDSDIIEALRRFRQENPTEGFGRRLSLLKIVERYNSGESSGEFKNLTEYRHDKQEILDRLLKQERRDIRNLWGVDCPPDINSDENYFKRLQDNQGMVSEWFRQEFERIGGDWEKLWRR